MTNRLLKLLMTSTLLAVSTMAGAAVQTDYDHSATFASYKTYSWIKVDGGDSLWSDRLRKDVDVELAAHGWQLVSSGGDVMVSAFRSTKSEKTLNTFYDGLGGGGGWGWRGFGGAGFGGTGFSTTTASITKVGNVVVDVFDSKSHKLLWRGSDSADLSSNASKNIAKLQRDVADMFKHFPPK